MKHHALKPTTTDRDANPTAARDPGAPPAAQPTITRRAAVLATTLGAAALWAGCDDSPAATDPGGDGGSGSGGASSASAGGHGGSAGHGGGGGMPPTPRCEESDDNIEGPYYTAGAPTTNVLADDTTPGVRLHLSGKVLSAGSCEALESAHLDFWQADAEGRYNTTRFAFRGQFDVDAEGSYSLETIIPGHYLNGNQHRPAHLHVKVSAPGHKLLTTQLYFSGDPYNDIDPFIEGSLIMPLSDAPDGGKNAFFVFALAVA